MEFGFRGRHHEPPGGATPGAASPEGPPESETTGSSSGSSSSSSSNETLAVLRRFEKAHRLDPNLPADEMREVDAVLASGNAEKGVEIEQVLVEDNSPYQEVRAAVRNHDIDVPANTIRAWTIGLLLCTLGSGVNVVFSLRSPSVTINTYLIQLVAYPIGLLWDLVFPDHQFDVLGLKFNLKPGRFNFKEHAVITVMFNAAYGGGTLYATDVILAQQHFFGQALDMVWQVLFAATTACLGLGLAGLARRFLVWPAAAIWPSALVGASLIGSLHDRSASDPAETDGWAVGRHRWLLAVAAAAFLWHWLPGWVFQGLTWFCWITWVWPENVVVNKLFGGFSGYGLMPVTLDWSVVAGYLGSPLVPPFHAVANTAAGVLVFFVVTSMGLHFSGHWYADYMPVQSSDAYDNTGRPYEVSFVLDKNLQFDEAEYHTYSPLYFSTQTALSYGLAFAATAAVVVHVALYHGGDLWARLKDGARREDDDVHMRLNRKFREAHDWWYAALLVVTAGASFAVVCAWPTSLPWWGFVVCVAVPLIWTVPIGVVQAATGIQLGLSVFTQYLAGYVLPGRPAAVMLFKSYSHLCVSQALSFAHGLKLGHYMKVPPRVLFWSQLVAAAWSAVVQVLVMAWALGAIDGACEETPRNRYVCPGARSAFTASVVWGAIGPRRLFGPGALYASLQWFWLLGAVAPFATWLLARRFPRSLWRYVSMPVFFGGSGFIPPATVYVYLCWALVGTIFNYFIKRRFPGWWARYNYVTSAALDCGLAVAAVVIFFALHMTQADVMVWFGNAEALGTLDMTSRAIKSSLPRGGIFGPESWS
ncbi:hypothetical protein RB594_005091 [Gaeumannomyces avenae]